MKRTALLSLIETYVPSAGIEAAMYLETREFVLANPDCFERTLQIGHVTASGWVVSAQRDRVLLMHHRKLDRWFQPGGHCDGESDVVFVARKEVEEETGISDLKPLLDGIFDIDIHLIPASSKDPAHYHYDIRFLFEADPAQQLIINSESKDLKWVLLNDIAHLNNSESIMRMVGKTTV